eukprot:gene45604-58244_t
MAKPLALKRAIGNLFDNALFYGKKVEITIRQSHAATAELVEIEIRDHGPGVPEDAMVSLFQPYVRLEHGRNSNSGGMGLGLGIARNIVQAHGGELLLRNHPQGALFDCIWHTGCGKVRSTMLQDKKDNRETFLCVDAAVVGVCMVRWYW